ncbi:type IV secretion system DNA-binding domain-containing protein [Sphingomonas sp. BIUV-7]|uniref:Type IV secretion system DNA-binding domain-containing protein n=1 Tax=Sphingomonas natans TaxID=3063330 RepID=A0ABT8Y9I6_9SPHN|nr:type IV secretion system DNA-binding domain-containing protein [Sphingomonas sp. BIUV-7]MDO6414359.1 type IV secretion system DNA-binding domain-containing protein [Sphingomonas sp. BIUV-7]
MKRNLKNFTRGSQLLENFGMMFAAGFKLPAWIAIIAFTLSAWWHCSTMLSEHSQYLGLMHVEASIYRWFQFDPDKAVNIQTGGGTIRLTWGTVLDYPPMVHAWAEVVAVLWRAFWTVVVALVPLFVFYYWYAVRFGCKAKQRDHIGGAQLASYLDLRRLIDIRNRPQRSKDMKAAFGSTWPLQSRLATTAELDAAGIYRPYQIAGIPFPYRLEQSHAMLIGTTGTGKTVELSSLVTQVRERNHRAVIFDLTGAFIERFYDEERDVILNPLDARCPQWSIFNECDTEAEFTTAWEALVPHDGGGSDPFWVQAARMLGVETCLKLKAEGRTSNGALYRELMTADLKHVHKLVERTLADPITAPEAARMAESVRAVLNTNAKPIRLLPDEGPSFSIKTWMMDDDGSGGVLFLSSRYVDMAVARTMLTTWLDTALNTLMTMPKTRDVRMWFLVDELGALHRLTALEKGLQTARNYGGAIVLGVHAFGKLAETYGQNVAQTLASLARTKLLLATDDRPTAVFESDSIGHRQFREMEEGYSYGYDNLRDAVTLTPRRNLEPLVLPDDIMNLENLHGYLKFPSGFPAAAVRLQYIDYPHIAEGFVLRAIALPPELTPQPTAAPSADAGSASAGKNGEGALSGSNPDGGQGIQDDPPTGSGSTPPEQVLEPKRESAGDQADTSVENATAWLNARLPTTSMPPVAQAETIDSRLGADGSDDALDGSAVGRRNDTGSGSAELPQRRNGNAIERVSPTRASASKRQGPSDADLSQQELRLAFVTKAEVEHHHHDHHPPAAIPDGLADSMGIGD